MKRALPGNKNTNNITINRVSVPNIPELNMNTESPRLHEIKEVIMTIKRIRDANEDALPPLLFTLVIDGGNNCSLVITQNTPEICPFLGILTNNNNNNNGEITPPLTIKTTTITAQNPKSTEATTTTTAAATIKPTNSSITTKTIDAAVTSTTPTAEKSTTKSSASVEPEPTPTTPTTNKTTTDNNKNTDSGSMSASGVIVTFLFCFALFIGCTLVLLRNENIRNKVRGVLTRNSNNGVQYSRVRHEDAANLLLQNVPNEDSDDEMLL